VPLSLSAMPASLSRVREKNGQLNEGIASLVSLEQRTYGVLASGAAYAAAMRRARRETTTRRASWPFWGLLLLALAGMLWYLFASDRWTVGSVATSKSTFEPIRQVQTNWPAR
jgi:hypothetical protein